MDFNFTVETKYPELVIHQTYEVFWKHNVTTKPMSIGTCKVNLNGNQVFCNATLSNGNIKHLTNDVVIAEFNFNDVLMGKYDYCTRLETNDDGQDELIGFCLEAK